MRFKNWFLIASALVFLSGCAATTNFSLGKGALTKGNYKEAIKSFELALKKNPSDADTLTYLGISYYKTGEYNKAIDKLSKAEELKPKEKRVKLYLGLAYLRIGDDTKAEEELRSYTGIDSGSKVSTQVRRALVLLENEEVSPKVRDLIVANIEASLESEDEIERLKEEREKAYEYYSPGFPFPYYGYYGPPLFGFWHW